MKDQVSGYVREALALGLRRSAGMIYRRARGMWDRMLGLDERRRRSQELSEPAWRAGLGGLTVEEASNRFLGGAATVGWAASTAPETVREYLQRNCSDHVQRILAAASQIQAGRASLFGEWVQIRGPDGRIDWQRDWLGGRSWKAEIPSHAIPVGRQAGMDPRVAWELGRGHHWVTLAQAYVLTGDIKPAEEAIAQIDEFICANATGYGIQWASTMDVAIRAANCLVAWDLLRNAPVAKDIAIRVLRSLVEHGRYIIGHMDDRDGIRSNHYLADLAGIAYLSRLSRIWPQFREWPGLWRTLVRRELRDQFWPDGFNFEASTSYHRLATELVLYPAVFACSPNNDNSAWVHRRLMALVQAIQTYSTPVGRAPQFGDNDSGRLHVLDERPDSDHSYLCALGYALLDTPSSTTCPEVAWVLGPPAAGIPQPAVRGVGLLPDAGIICVNDSTARLVATCGPNGQDNRGGHAHNDKLSFVFDAANEEIIVDPGSYVYTADPATRRQFRATSFHSTLAFADEEQNRFSFVSTFRLLPDSIPVPWRTRTGSGALIVASASHSGYERPPLALRHHRRLAHRLGSTHWSILDVVRRTSGRGHRRDSVPFLLTLPLAPGVTVRHIRAREWTILTVRGTRVRGESILRNADGAWSTESGWYSPAYGRRVPTTFLRLRGTLSPSARCHALWTTFDVSS